MKNRLAAEIAGRSNVALWTGTECNRIDLDGDDAVLTTSRGEVTAGGVFIVAYAGINRLLMASGLPPLDLKAEIAEICLVDVPEWLRRRAITVMDGPFFSVMPMPAVGRHSFTHVRYTPHVSWHLGERPVPPYEAMDKYDKTSRFVFMQKDAQRFVSMLKALRYRGSMFEVKVIPSRNEIDDGRPIVFHCHREEPLCVSVLGSKLDSVYQLEAAVNEFLGLRREPPRPPATRANGSVGRSLP